MAVDINSLKYIPDLPAASVANGSDLLHLSQGGNDKQLSVTALLKFLVSGGRPIGSLYMTGVKGNDPNKLFPGQTWVRHASGRSLRVCLDDESNLGQQLGADTMSLTEAHLPPHSHGAGTLVAATAGNHTHSGQTSTVGNHTHSAWTSSAGNHNHQCGMRGPGAQWQNTRSGSDNSRDYPLNYTSVNGAHTHTVGMNAAGAHNHTFTTSTNGGHTHGVTGSTANTGSGAAFSLIPATIVVGCWIRTA